MKIKYFLFLIIVSSLSSFSCNYNTSLSLWNRTFKSNGKQFVDWNDKVNDTINKSKYQIIKENFDKNNIDFDESGYIFNIGDIETVGSFNMLNAIYEFPINNFDDFKYCIDDWWNNDKNILDEFTSFYGLKKNIDKSKFIFKLNNNNNGVSNFPNGTMTLEFVDYNQKTSKDVYYAYDESTSQDGSELLLYKEDSDKLILVGYAFVARKGKGIDIVQIRSGYEDETAVKLKFVFTSEVNGVKELYLTNYIVIQEDIFRMPTWGIVLIAVGSTILVLVPTIFVIKKVKRKKNN